MTTATELIALLAARHAADVFVAECKNGPSYGPAGTLQKMDAFAMKRSWAQPCAWCYEVKVSRGDFLGDNKWHGYLPLCNQFYFVTPWKLVLPEEVPAEAGLIWASKNCTRLYTKKKASHRDQDMPADLLQYILQSRAQITPPGENMSTTGSDRNVDYWRAWLKKKAENRYLGWRVSAEIRKTVSEQIDKVICENQRLKTLVDGLEELRDILREAGVDESALCPWQGPQAVANKLQRLIDGIPEGLDDTLDRALNGIKTVRESLRNIRTTKPVKNLLP